MFLLSGIICSKNFPYSFEVFSKGLVILNKLPVLGLGVSHHHHGVVVVSWSHGRPRIVVVVDLVVVVVLTAARETEFITSIVPK